ncbi:hypothetical protein [Kribbella sp. NPDC006257]|uniref:hypothetical protein n=1 Tax=Kribbella sp. NPDC006257 TaxID=3156738 RepID=UPI0033A73FAA
MLTQSIAALLLLSSGVTPPNPGTHKILAADVRIAWSDTTHTKVAISWTETTPAPNTIVLQRDGFDDVRLGTTAIGAPNQLVVDAPTLVASNNPGEVARIVVDEPTGEQGRSVGFDRFIPGVVDPDLAVTADGGVRWSIPPITAPDTTPNDPLDLDQPARYKMTLRLNELPHTEMDCGEVTLPSTTEPTGVIANRNKPYDLFLDTLNEWAPGGLHGGFGGYAHVSTTGLTLTAPSTSAYGVPISLTGTLSGRTIYESGHPPACQETDSGIGSGELVTLQGRNTTTGPWYVIGSTHTVAGGKYTFTMNNPGAREYRTVVPNVNGQGSARYGSTTASKLVRATTRVMSAKFITPTISYGTQPQAYLWVDPPNAQRAALQFKNASGAWQGVAYKTLYAGKGLLQFPWNRRGVTQFRWYIPASTHNSLPVAAVYSGAFSLTVR